MAVSACSDGAPTVQRQSPTTGGAVPQSESSSAPDTDSPETWVGDDLPLVASPVAVLDDTAVYFTAVETDQFVTVVDLVERRELWRRPSHQQGRIRGVVGPPYVDVRTERVVVTTYDDLTQAPEMAAFDLRTGDEQWRRPVDWAQHRPSRCVGATQVCFDTVGGLITELDPDGGPFEVTVDGGLERTIGGGGDLRLSADPRGGRIEMGAIVQAGYETRWERTFADFVPPSVAARYGPDGGWNADVDHDTGASLFLVGSLAPDDIYERPELRLTTCRARCRRPSGGDGGGRRRCRFSDPRPHRDLPLRWPALRARRVLDV